MLAYAVTIFTGAFLLFQVQPLIGSYVLPWFGGRPGASRYRLYALELYRAGKVYHEPGSPGPAK